MPLIAESMASLWSAQRSRFCFTKLADSQPCDIAHDRNARSEKRRTRHSRQLRDLQSMIKGASANVALVSIKSPNVFAVILNQFLPRDLAATALPIRRQRETAASTEGLERFGWGRLDNLQYWAIPAQTSKTSNRERGAIKFRVCGLRARNA